MSRIIPLLIAFSVIMVACSGGESSVTDPTVTNQPPAPVSTINIPDSAFPIDGAAHDTPVPAEPPPSNSDSTRSDAFTRLGSHLFMPVSESRSIAGLGELLETISMDGSDVFEINGDEIVATAGGTACFRFGYREELDENGVQTVCAVAFDLVGECGANLPRARLDLNAFLDSGGQSTGDANLLESGNGLFYAACIDDHSRYVLQPSTADLPPLYWRIVDALGSGAYSLGTSEIEAQRAGGVTTFSGDEIRPPWVVSISREIEQLEITATGLIINDNDCDTSPACTPFSDTVIPGDVLSVGIGLPFEILDAVVADYSPSQLNEYVETRIGVPWPAVLERDPAIHPAVLSRLFHIDVMGQIVPAFDEIYRLRDKDVTVALQSSARSIMPMCRPEPENVVQCQALEDAIGDYEADQISALGDDGYKLWTAVGVEYRDGGQYDSVADFWRPHLSNFSGVLGLPAANDFWATDNIAESIANAVRGLASEVSPDQKVILTLGGPPITANTGSGGFCEAEICPSDFDAAYEQFEAWLTAAVESFEPDQLVGVATALFEGSHFDIRDPYEQFEHFALNRVGETGYNHPALNIWRAR